MEVEVVLIVVVVVVVIVLLVVGGGDVNGEYVVLCNSVDVDVYV